MIINHNLPGMNAINRMNTNSANATKSMQKLSSGLRINSAADDAAGLAISEKMRGQIRGLDQASANAQDGISLVQTAEGALSETESILQRMRELAVQASNDTNTADDRGEIQKEMNQLTSEINRIGNTTEFNTQKLLDGSKEFTEATNAKVTGNTVGTTIDISASATVGKATAGAAAGLTITKGGNTLTGTKAYAGHAVNNNGPNVTASDNELTVTLDGVQKSVALTVADYSTGADDSGDTFAAEIQTKLNAAFGAGSFTVGFDASDKLTISTTDASKSLTIDGGNALTHLLTTPGTDTFAETTTAANNTLSVTVNGTTKEVTLTAATYGSDALLAAEINTQLDTAFGSDVADVTAAAGVLTIETNATGTGNSVTSISGNAAANLGFNASTTYTEGVNDSTAVEFTVDGKSFTTTIAAGNYDANVLAGTLEAQLNGVAGISDAKVEYTDGKFSVTTGTEGTAGSVAITDNDFAKVIGLSTSGGAVATAGADEANAALKFQIGANNGQTMSAVISDMRADALGISSANTAEAITDNDGNVVANAAWTQANDVTNGTDSTPAEYALDVSTADRASAAIEVLDNAISKVSSERSKLGAYQNRLEHTINNLGTSSENLTSAESRIRDVDMAKEMSTFSKNNILSQAAQAMLAQANTQPQQVLQLLR